MVESHVSQRILVVLDERARGRETVWKRTGKVSREEQVTPAVRSLQSAYVHPAGVTDLNGFVLWRPLGSYAGCEG